MTGMLLFLVGMGMARAAQPSAQEPIEGWQERSPLQSGLLVGGGAVVGSVGGALAGGALGLGLGAAWCRPDAFECYGPLVGTGAGAIGGSVAGGVLAAGWTAQRLDLAPKRVRRWGLLTLAGGVTLYGVGRATDLWGLQRVGLYGGLGGLPVAMGIAAGTDAKRRVNLSVYPVLREEERGLRLSGRF